MALFFTADTHFCDHRTINVCKRPFANVTEMNEALTANCNAIAGPNDKVSHLGNFTRQLRNTKTFLDGLNGTKRLVSGNDDHPALGEVPRLGERAGLGRARRRRHPAGPLSQSVQELEWPAAALHHTLILSVVAIPLTQMVLNGQLRSDRAMHLKTHELVLALEGARNEIAGIEARSIEELEELARQQRDGDHAAPRS